MVRLLVDENISKSTIKLCRDLGLDVKSVVEEGFQGTLDEELKVSPPLMYRNFKVGV